MTAMLSSTMCPSTDIISMTNSVLINVVTFFAMFSCPSRRACASIGTTCIRTCSIVHTWIIFKALVHIYMYKKLKTLKFEIIMQNPNFPSIVNVKNIRDEKCA